MTGQPPSRCTAPPPLSASGEVRASAAAPSGLINLRTVIPSALTSHSRQYRVEYPLAVGSMRKAQLDAMAQEATVDCYNAGEQLTGFFTMIDEKLAVPFETRVLSVHEIVEGVARSPGRLRCLRSLSSFMRSDSAGRAPRS